MSALLLLACSSPETLPPPPEPPEVQEVEATAPIPPQQILDLQQRLGAYLGQPGTLQDQGHPWMSCMDRQPEERCKEALPVGWRVEVAEGELSLAAQITEIRDWPAFLASWEERMPTTSRNGHAVLYEEGVLYELKLGCLEQERFEAELERFRATLDHHPSVVVSPCGLVHLPIEQRAPEAPASEGSPGSSGG